MDFLPCNFDTFAPQRVHYGRCLALECGYSNSAGRAMRPDVEDLPARFRFGIEDAHPIDYLDRPTIIENRTRSRMGRVTAWIAEIDRIALHKGISIDPTHAERRENIGRQETHEYRAVATPTGPERVAVAVLVEIFPFEPKPRKLAITETVRGVTRSRCVVRNHCCLSCRTCRDLQGKANARETDKSVSPTHAHGEVDDTSPAMPPYAIVQCASLIPYV